MSFDKDADLAKKLVDTLANEKAPLADSVSALAIALGAFISQRKETSTLEETLEPIFDMIRFIAHRGDKAMAVLRNTEIKH